MKKILLIAVLCLALLVGCAQKQSADTTEASADPTDTEAAQATETTPETEPEEPEVYEANGTVIGPLEPLFRVADGTLPDGNYAAQFADGDFTLQNGRLSLTFTVYDHERFDPEQISRLVPGDTLKAEGGAYVLQAVRFEDVADELPLVIFNSETHHTDLDAFLYLASNQNRPSVGHAPFTVLDGEAEYYVCAGSDSLVSTDPVGSITLPCAADAVFRSEVDDVVNALEYPLTEYVDEELRQAHLEAYRANMDPNMFGSGKTAPPMMLLRIESGEITMVCRCYAP